MAAPRRVLFSNYLLNMELPWKLKRTAPVKRAWRMLSPQCISTRVSNRLIEKDLLKSDGRRPPVAASRADASRLGEEMVDEDGFVKDEAWCQLLLINHERRARGLAEVEARK